MAFPKGLLDVSKLLSMHGIEEVVVCPGSRNAPIIVALERNPDLTLYSIIDERSAGFFALGRALATQKPVAICCTSGSAGLNLAPALSEAYYQEIPLLALTADRPAEWIDQWDGQTIQQKNFLSTTVKKSLEFPNSANSEETLDWFQQRIANEAILSLTDDKHGPVHLNIPISEPFYPEKGEALNFPENIKKIQIHEFESYLNSVILDFLENTYKEEQKIILSIGQIENSKGLEQSLELLKNSGIVILGDSTANASNYLIQNHDLILSNDKNWSKLKPELVIHIGKSHVSKRIKQFLKSQKPIQNWLIRKTTKSTIIDTFQSLTEILNVDATFFLEIFSSFILQKNISKLFKNDWEKISKNVSERQLLFIKSNNKWNELAAIQSIFKTIENTDSSIHFGNSLSIRYSNWLSFFPKGSIYCNRGTSGIDGTISTYIAATTKSNEISYLILGDLSFQYDKNGLWNQYINKNQRIIVMNNSGGGIFRNLDGAKDLPELEKYIATNQQNSAKNIALDANMIYLSAQSLEELKEHLEYIQKDSKQAIVLEIFTDPQTNKVVLGEYMGLFKS